MLSRVLALLVGYLAQPVKRQTASATTDARSLAAVLRSGDVLLSDGRTRAAALVRRVTRSPWAHVSMYVGRLEEGPDPRCIVEADVAAGVRAVSLSELDDQRIRVLRATFLGDDERRRLADWVVSRIGDGYDLPLALVLAARLLRVSLPGKMRLVPGAMAEGTRRFICSSLLAQAFLLVGYQICPGPAAVRLKEEGHLTPRDFDGASGFEVVRIASN
jgi:hypothetical protein